LKIHKNTLKDPLVYSLPHHHSSVSRDAVKYNLPCSLNMKLTPVVDLEPVIPAKYSWRLKGRFCPRKFVKIECQLGTRQWQYLAAAITRSKWSNPIRRWSYGTAICVIPDRTGTSSNASTASLKPAGLAPTRHKKTRYVTVEFGMVPSAGWHIDAYRFKAAWN